jgi:preprotein translocase subunit SecG
MGFLIGLLTLVMVADCLVLIFLVLIQLPKKEAGAGLAFGGSATDALFGAGSGTVLTKITKYAATAFFVLALLLSVMQGKYHRRTTTEFERNMDKPLQPSALAPAAPPAAAPASTPAPTTPTASASLLTATNLATAPAVEATNLPVPPTKTTPLPAAPK